MLYALGVLFCVSAWIARHEPPAPIILSVVALLMLILAPCFHHLTIADEGDRLAICFGPLPLFQRRIRYADIQDVEIGRTMLIEGWGIHISLCRRGWVWNIWGRDCVVIRHKGILRLGTNDPENLVQFLKARISAHLNPTKRQA
jgi:hypothetical protein